MVEAGMCKKSSVSACSVYCVEPDICVYTPHRILPCQPHSWTHSFLRRICKHTLLVAFAWSQSVCLAIPCSALVCESFAHVCGDQSAVNAFCEEDEVGVDNCSLVALAHGWNIRLVFARQTLSAADEMFQCVWPLLFLLRNIRAHEQGISVQTGAYISTCIRALLRRCQWLLSNVRDSLRIPFLGAGATVRFVAIHP